MYTVRGVYGMIEKLLLGNLWFRETDFTPNIDYYRELTGSQHPETLWIGCSDSRLQTGHITQALTLHPGKIMKKRVLLTKKRHAGYRG